MTDFKILYLADCPEHIEACAAWLYGQWGVMKEDRSFEKTVISLKESSQKNVIPMTIIALDEKNRPIGMARLKHTDGTRWDDMHTPWIASVFVHYMHRAKGVARALITKLEEEAKRLKYETVYLHTDSVKPMYEHMRYEIMEEDVTDETASGTRTLFRKEL